jgi:isopentenyl phosphate kinase
VNLTFLKLGGSLITEKERPQTVRPQTLARLAEEIAAAQQANPGLRLLLGHGSGSFGHVPARKHGTRLGVHTQEQWLGFVEVWRAATALNRFVVDAFSAAGLPVISFPPSASVTAHSRYLAEWNLTPIRQALANGLLPVVFGDVIFDTAQGGTIFSTEDLFSHLAEQLAPQRILLASLQPGVWEDFPACTRLLPEIMAQDLERGALAIGESAAADVTGGMRSKVMHGLELARRLPGVEVRIFSGEQPGDVQRALAGEGQGTLLRP